MTSLYRGIVGGNCASTSEYYRNELMKLGFPKNMLKYGVLKDGDKDHVVLIVDATGQINSRSWRLEKIKG